MLSKWISQRGLLLLTLSLTLVLSTGTAEQLNNQQLQQRLNKLFQIPSKQFSIFPSELPSYKIFHVQGNFGLISTDGKYLIQGEVMNTETGKSVISEVQNQQQLKVLRKLPQTLAISYPAKQQSAAIWVFTDVNCYYCQKLHRDISQLNDLGVSVHYYSFPRSGDENQQDWQKAAKVWCAKEQKQAMDKAKALQDVFNLPQVSDCSPRIKEQYLTGVALGVRGTPTIVLETGRILNGYRPVANLAEEASK